MDVQADSSPPGRPADMGSGSQLSHLGATVALQSVLGSGEERVTPVLPCPQPPCAWPCVPASTGASASMTVSRETPPTPAPASRASQGGGATWVSPPQGPQAEALSLRYRGRGWGPTGGQAQGPPGAAAGGAGGAREGQLAAPTPGRGASFPARLPPLRPQRTPFCRCERVRFPPVSERRDLHTRRQQLQLPVPGWLWGTHL